MHFLPLSLQKICLTIKVLTLNQKKRRPFNYRQEFHLSNEKRIINLKEDPLKVPNQKKIHPCTGQKSPIATKLIEIL
jgi:hypothetical protein